MCIYNYRGKMARTVLMICRIQLQETVCHLWAHQKYSLPWQNVISISFQNADVKNLQVDNPPAAFTFATTFNGRKTGGLLCVHAQN